MGQQTQGNYFADIIANAKKNIRAMKRVQPGMFGEYLELQAAIKDFKEAGERLAKARRAWRNLGR